MSVTGHTKLLNLPSEIMWQLKLKERKGSQWFPNNSDQILYALFNITTH